jgi:hypothetical protein
MITQRCFLTQQYPREKHLLLTIEAAEKGTAFEIFIVCP